MPQSQATENATVGQTDRLIPAYLLGIIGVVVFGATLPITRLALEDFSPLFITFFRAGIAAFLAIVLLRVLTKPLRHRSDFAIFFAGLFVIFGFPGAMAFAMQTVPASHGGVVLGLLPITVAALARMFAGESPSPRFWVLSTIGGLIVAGFAFLKADEAGIAGFSAGDIWLVLAGLFASSGYVIFGKLSRETPGWEIISRALVLNLPLILPGIWWFYEPKFLTSSLAGLLALTYLGVFSMFVGFWAWNVALAWGGIARIGQLQLFQTFITLAIAALLLGEHVDLVTLGVAVVITAIIAATRNA